MQERVRDALGGLRIVDLLPQVKRPPPIIAAERLVVQRQLLVKQVSARQPGATSQAA